MLRRGLWQEQFLFEWSVPVQIRLRGSRCRWRLHEGLHAGCLRHAGEVELLSIPREPWEQGRVVSCSNGTVTVERPRRTNGSKYRYTDFPTNSQLNVNKGNVCALDLGVSRGGGGHSHAHFVWDRDRLVQCHSRLIRMEREVDDYNEENVNFSTEDKRVARRVNGGAGRRSTSSYRSGTA